MSWTLASIVTVLLTAAPPAASGVTGAEAPPTLADLAFMTGGWRADWNGQELEEHFTVPHAGSMVGMFRWCSGDATRFTEHMVLERREDGVHLFLRHFNPGSVPWEQETAGPMAFRLAEAASGRAVFEHATIPFPRRIIYHRTDPHTLVARLEGRGDDGAAREMEFTFRSIDMPTTTTDTLTAAGQKLGYTGGLTIAFNVKDMSKAIEWYQNTLGFKLVYKLDEMGWCELSTANQQVMVGLSQVEEPKVGGPVPTFGVKDIDETRRQLEAKRVRFDGPTQEIPDMVKLATFYDPDGNALMLYQSLTEQP